MTNNRNHSPERKRASVFAAFMRAKYIPRSHYIAWTLPFVLLLAISRISSPPLWVDLVVWIIGWIPIMIFEYQFTAKEMKRLDLL
jgi:hypothetical protein